MNFLSALFLISASVVAQSQENSKELPPLPPGPLIQKRAPDYAQWQIRLSLPKTADGNESKPVRGSLVSMTKTGNIVLRQMLDENGQTWNTWCMGPMQITLWPGEKNWIVESGPGDPLAPSTTYEDYSQTDFPGFDWISEKNYAGVQKVSGKDCIVFKDNIKPLPDEGPVEYNAYIDLQSRYPVALKNADGTHFYEFKVPPTAMLMPPKIVLDLLKNRQRSIDASSRRMPAR